MILHILIDCFKIVENQFLCVALWLLEEVECCSGDR